MDNVLIFTHRRNRRQRGRTTKNGRNEASCKVHGSDFIMCHPIFLFINRIRAPYYRISIPNRRLYVDNFIYRRGYHSTTQTHTHTHSMAHIFSAEANCVHKKIMNILFLYIIHWCTSHLFRECGCDDSVPLFSPPSSPSSLRN